MATSRVARMAAKMSAERVRLHRDQKRDKKKDIQPQLGFGLDWCIFYNFCGHVSP